MKPSQSMAKRFFDITISLSGLIVLLPLFAIVALAVKLTSSGPVLYRQIRIGRNSKPFTCVKFRTMKSDAEKGGTVTTADDSRVTRVGRILRRGKLDELPQLWNVLAGKMSFVGPRPDVPGYADRLEGKARKVLELRPGITGPASIFFRHEESILASVADPKEYNDTVIWPLKVRMNLEYAEQWSFRKDLGFIAVTVLPFLNRILKVVPEPPKDSQGVS